MVNICSEIDSQSSVYCPSGQIMVGSQEQDKTSISLERRKFIPLYKAANEPPKGLLICTVYNILKNDQEG